MKLILFKIFMRQIIQKCIIVPFFADLFGQCSEIRCAHADDLLHIFMRNQAFLKCAVCFIFHGIQFSEYFCAFHKVPLFRKYT